MVFTGDPTSLARDNILYYTFLLTGGVLTSLGFLGSSMVPNLEYLYITYGVLVGFGINLIILADSTIIPQYFREKLPLASGIAMTGVAIGVFLFAAVNEYFIGNYGLEGAFLILAGISLNGVPLGMLMKMPVKQKDETQPLVQENQPSISHDQTPDQSSILITLGLDLFKNRQFTLGIISSVLIIIPHHVIPTVLPDYILWLRWSSQEATNTLVFMGLANMLSRLFIWDLTGQDPRSWLLILCISRIFSGISLLVACLFTQYWMFVLLCIVFGILRGLYVIFYYLLLIRIVGTKRTHHGVGIMYTAWGIGILIGLTGSGIIADISFENWGYIFVLIFVGGAEVVGGLIFLLMRILWKEDNKC